MVSIRDAEIPGEYIISPWSEKLISPESNRESGPVTFMG
jgi:hypothetical protein